MFHTFNLGKSTFFFLCISPPPHHAVLLYLSLYPPHSLSLPSLVSELLSLSLSLPELTTQEVTTDSINSSYINPAIIAPPACLSAPHPPHSLLLLHHIHHHPLTIPFLPFLHLFVSSSCPCLWILDALFS